MTDTGLDNPFWTALQTRHRAIAQRHGDVARFPAPFAPFLAVADADVDAGAAFAALIAAGESVYLLGVAPRLPPDWRLDPFRPLLQLVCPAPVVAVDGPEIVALSEPHRADALALTALVYPHFFRERTLDLGRYFGIYRHGRLAAMIGERLATPDATEISAVCTHPDAVGRGHARQLLAMLSNDLHARGRAPFLHVNHDNARAIALYERNGYRRRREIPFWRLSRASDPRG